MREEESERAQAAAEPPQHLIKYCSMGTCCCDCCLCLRQVKKKKLKSKRRWNAQTTRVQQYKAVAKKQKQKDRSVQELYIVFKHLNC